MPKKVYGDVELVDAASKNRFSDSEVESKGGDVDAPVTPSPLEVLEQQQRAREQAAACQSTYATIQDAYSYKRCPVKNVRKNELDCLLYAWPFTVEAIEQDIAKIRAIYGKRHPEILQDAIPDALPLSTKLYYGFGRLFEGCHKSHPYFAAIHAQIQVIASSGSSEALKLVLAQGVLLLSYRYCQLHNRSGRFSEMIHVLLVKYLPIVYRSRVFNDLTAAIVEHNHVCLPSALPDSPTLFNLVLDEAIVDARLKAFDDTICAKEGLVRLSTPDCASYAALLSSGMTELNAPASGAGSLGL